jgi:hypothetical protein
MALIVMKLNRANYQVGGNAAESALIVRKFCYLENALEA